MLKYSGKLFLQALYNNTQEVISLALARKWQECQDSRASLSVWADASDVGKCCLGAGAAAAYAPGTIRRTAPFDADQIDQPACSGINAKTIQLLKYTYPRECSHWHPFAAGQRRHSSTYTPPIETGHDVSRDSPPAAVVLERNNRSFALARLASHRHKTTCPRRRN